MKKVLNYILLTAVLGTFLPYSVLAETTAVGVNITGSVSIDVVTTISTNITLDLTTGETTPTYMEIQNNSSVPVNAKITNISTTSEGAPSTFVDSMEKDWYNLSKEETSTYVNFNILGEGQDAMYKNILPNTEIDLGTLLVNTGMGADVCVGFPCYMEENYMNAKIFKLNANFGMNWSEGNKNFTYQIETVYSQADSYSEENYSMPSFLNNVNDLNVYVANCDNEIVCTNNEAGIYLNLKSSQISEEFVNKLNNDEISISVNVNGKFATQYDTFKITDSGYEKKFYIDALETGKTHYLTIRIDLHGDRIDYENGFGYNTNTSFTFFKKVLAYNE